MPKQQQSKHHTDQEQQETKQRHSAIGKHVILALGQPGNLHRVQVQPLWEGHYRVNILVGEDASATKVAHSFFLVADNDGNIITSTPNITMRYQQMTEGGRTPSPP